MQFTILGSDLKRLVSTRGGAVRLVLTVSDGMITANSDGIPVGDSRDGAALIGYKVANALADIGHQFKHEQLTFTKSTFTSFSELPRSGLRVPHIASCLHLSVGKSEFNLLAYFGSAHQDLGEAWIVRVEPRMSIYIDITGGEGRVYQKKIGSFSLSTGPEETTLLRFSSQLAYPDIEGWHTRAKSNQRISSTLSIRSGFLFLGGAVVAKEPSQTEQEIAKASAKLTKPQKPVKVDHRFDKVIELLAAGHTVREVVAMAGVTERTVFNWKRKWKLTLTQSQELA